eukprot:325880-Chlamydomonas_euryale.AAC.4
MTSTRKLLPYTARRAWGGQAPNHMHACEPKTTHVRAGSCMSTCAHVDTHFLASVSHALAIHPSSMPWPTYSQTPVLLFPAPTSFHPH